jgi:regulator of CtrA degradation
MGLTEKVINALYMEAMVLADEARAYFDQFGREARLDMSPLQRVSFSCESLKVTTRLMHTIAWLLSQRASQTLTNSLAAAAPSDADTVAGLPEEAQDLIRASEDLYARIQRLDRKLAQPMAEPNPARNLRARLEQAF